MKKDDESLEETIQEAKQVLTEYLKDNKLRKTPERFAVLEAIYRIGSPFDSYDLYNQMKESKFRTSLATIYNTFIVLEKAHLLFRSKPNGRYSKFIVNNDMRAKNYLVCTHCGSVATTSNPKLSKALEKIKFTGFQSESYALYIYGMCQNCRLKMQKRNKKKATIQHEKR